MSTGDDRYQVVNDGRVWPPISRAEADRAVRLIIGHFGLQILASANVQWNMSKRLRTRTCWISRTSTMGVDRGWPRLVHDLSHDIFQYRHPGFKPHAGGHAALEREVRDYVLAKEWHLGKLKPRAPVKLSTDAKRIKRLAQIEAGILRWESKAKRADNALRKLRRQLKAHVRNLQVTL